MTKRPPIIVGLLFMLTALWLIFTPNKPIRHFLARLENIGYDLQLRAHTITAKPLPPESPVVIVDIDDKSIHAEGRWPWSRATLAKLIQKMKDQGAVVIAFDIFFPEPQENIADEVAKVLNEHNLLNNPVKSMLYNNAALFDDDDKFITSMKDVQVVLSYTFLPRPETHNLLPLPLLQIGSGESKRLDLTKAEGYISNIPIIQKAASASGFINIFPDDDGIVRRVPLLMEYKDGIYPSLALQAVLSFLGTSKVELVAPGYLNEQRLEGVRLGNYIIPTDESGNVYIPFIGRSYSFPYFSAVDILQDRIPKDSLLGKIVFVGTSATGLGDLQPASVQNPFPGVEIQASVSNGILLKQFSYKPAWTLGADAILTFILGILAAMIFPYLGPRILALILLFFPILILYVNGYIWRQTGLILSFLTPMIMVLLIAIFNLLYGYVFETRRREQLKKMFGQYVPEKHINEMLRSKDTFSLHGESKDMTVMFADIRNFTTIAEGMAATDIVDMLNTYFTPMTEIIHQSFGTVDKYIGDLIMAFWGAPLNDNSHATHAIQAALNMQAKLAQLRGMPSNNQWPEIIMGIGINSGKMNVGDMGSQFRRNYTVLGDAVNLASRIESLTKFYNVHILITENTQKDQPGFVFRKIDRVQVKGRAEGIDLYEVICRQDALTSEQAEELHEYHTALNYYQNRQFKEAHVLFENLTKRSPHIKIYGIYLTRTQEFIETPPPDSWDGIFTHAHK